MARARCWLTLVPPGNWSIFPLSIPALRGPHISLPLCFLSLRPALLTIRALLMMHMGILAQRGRVTQLPDSQVLALGSCTCGPLPVTGRRRQPAPHKGNLRESELKIRLTFL